MKFLGKAMAVLLAATVLISILPFALAASAEYKVESGRTAKLKMEFTNIEGLEIHEIKVDNPGIIVSKKYDDSQLGMNQMASNGDAATWLNIGSAVSKAVLYLDVQVKGTVGAKCNISVSYTASYDMGLRFEQGTRDFTVTIKAAATKPSTTTKPTTPVDYTQLNAQIAVARGLEQEKFTVDSWAVLVEALTNAESALKSKKQDTVDKAAENLQNAIAALVKMNMTDLVTAIQAAEKLLKDYQAGGLWAELANALSQANELISSGDQAAVDEAVQRLLAAIAAVRQYQESQTATPPGSLTVPTKPTTQSADCSVSVHRIWPILFWVSFAVNMVLIVVIAVYILSKKKNRKDTTPLVQYNIEDDDE